MNELDPQRQAAGVLSRPKIPRSIKMIRDRPDWADIQRDIMMGTFRADDICRKYNIKNDKGEWAIVSVIRYGQWLREKNSEAFAKMDEGEQRAIVNERMTLHREVADKARAAYEAAMALSETIKSGRGKAAKMESNPTPNFVAAKEFLDVLLSCADKLGESFGINNQPQQVQQPSVVQTFNLLALPKAESARPKVLEITKSA